jgi:hypothetical protein
MWLCVLHLSHRAPSTGCFSIVTVLKRSLNVAAPSADQALIVRLFPARALAGVTKRLHIAGHTAKAAKESLGIVVIIIHKPPT